jgi:co-chaperonin GroES (HSP10)
MTWDTDKAKPIGDWLLCEALPPKFCTGKLVMPISEDKDVVTEGVAKVLSIGDGIHTDSGAVIPHGVRPGDLVLFRGFLRYAQSVGDMFGAVRASKIFFVKVQDVLAIVEGPGTLGYYSEYQL